MQNHIPNHIEGYVKLENCLNLKRITTYQKTGLPLEVAQYDALHILGIKNNPNDFFDYASNQSTKERARIDNWFKVRRENETHFFVFEDKNPKEDNNIWSPSWIQEEIFDRSHSDKNLQSEIRKEKDAGQKVILHKIAVCSFFKGTRQNKRLMNEFGWTVIELGFQVTKETFKKAIGVLVRKLYWIKKNFFDKPVQTRISSYTKSSKPMYRYVVISLNDCSVKELFRRYKREFNELNMVSSTEFRGYG